MVKSRFFIRLTDPYSYQGSPSWEKWVLLKESLIKHLSRYLDLYKISFEFTPSDFLGFDYLIFEFLNEIVDKFKENAKNLEVVIKNITTIDMANSVRGVINKFETHPEYRGIFGVVNVRYQILLAMTPVNSDQIEETKTLLSFYTNRANIRRTVVYEPHLHDGFSQMVKEEGFNGIPHFVDHPKYPKNLKDFCIRPPVYLERYNELGDQLYETIDILLDNLEKNYPGEPVGKLINMDAFWASQMMHGCNAGLNLVTIYPNLDMIGCYHENPSKPNPNRVVANLGRNPEDLFKFIDDMSYSEQVNTDETMTLNLYYPTRTCPRFGMKCTDGSDIFMYRSIQNLIKCYM